MLSRPLSQLQMLRVGADSYYRAALGTLYLLALYPTAARKRSRALDAQMSGRLRIFHRSNRPVHWLPFAASCCVAPPISLHIVLLIANTFQSVRSCIWLSKYPSVIEMPRLEYPHLHPGNTS